MDDKQYEQYEQYQQEQYERYEQEIRRKNFRDITNPLGIYGLITGAVVAGVFIARAFEPTPPDSRLPQPTYQQVLRVDESYKSGLAYTLLTDLDHDFSWDIAEETYIGNHLGTTRTDVYFKKGFGPAQSIPQKDNLHFVEADFFKRYDK